jgi:hypothetical protein
MVFCPQYQRRISATTCRAEESRRQLTLELVSSFNFLSDIEGVTSEEESKVVNLGCPALQVGTMNREVWHI